MKFTIDLSWLLPFLSSNFFVAFSIVLSAIYIVYYYKRLESAKRSSIARALISEIRMAERGIEEIAHNIDNYMLGEYREITTLESWKKARRYIATGLDDEELALIADFKRSIDEINFYIKKEKEIYWKNASAKAAAVQKKLADAVIRSYHNGRIDKHVLSNYKKIVLDTITHDEYIYFPKHSVKMLDSYVVRARRISDTSVWPKLKKMAAI